ncbi:ParB/RepB/Spo0J family partition protein [Paeniglutamicibacter sp. NPDC091659]|uniref:ParB/RepB/Spo0J family partition protein n=1 Tax=Paeniglutamicibacter sp. NPDC091659 TaxID=3364389 RepID=UPI003828BB05
MNTQRIEQVDPRSLTVDTNVRTVAELGTDFIASIKEHGVLQPVTVHEKNGTLHVLMGQRRTLSAIEAECQTIPVYVVATPEEADRLATQVVENDQRQELTHADRAEAFHQLSLLGMTPTKIAKRTGAQKETVAQALKAKANTAAAASLGQGLTIEQAAKIAEFDGHEKIISHLTETALEEPAEFAHLAQRHLDQLAEDAAVEAAKAELVEAGKALATAEEMRFDGTAKAVTSLNRPDGEPATEEDATAYHVRVLYNGKIETTPVVQEWKAAGFADRWGNSGSGSRSGPMTEEQKAERKELISRNKDMDSAITVRHAWITNLLARKTAPKGYLHFVAKTMSAHSYELSRSIQEMAATFAGIKIGGFHPVTEHTAKVAARSEFAILALCFAAYEKHLDRTAWRNPTADTREYFAQLIAWGYTPSAVEKLITNEPTAE